MKSDLTVEKGKLEGIEKWVLFGGTWIKKSHGEDRKEAMKRRLTAQLDANAASNKLKRKDL